MIIVFGASGTLGNEITKQLIKSNLDILLTANTGYNKLLKSYSEEKRVVHVQKCDVQKKDDVLNLFDFMFEKKIQIDAVINNFAYTYDSNENNYKSYSAEVKKVFEVNYQGVSLILENLISYLKSVKRENVRVVNVLSNSIKTLNASNHHYIASKAATKTLSEFYAKNFSELCSINNVCPGLMQSNLTNSRFNDVADQIKELTPLKRLVSPKEVAKLILYLSIDSPLSLCGQTIYIDGGRTL